MRRQKQALHFSSDLAGAGKQLASRQYMSAWDFLLVFVCQCVSVGTNFVDVFFILALQ